MMSEPYISQISIFAFSFAPKGWALCNGQLLSIAQNQALFSLLGTTYGGDGIRTFGLPNLQGKAPMHFGNGYVQGQSGGEANYTLTINEIPAHTHTPQASNNAASTGTPGSGVALGIPVSNVGAVYTTSGGGTTLHPTAISTAGISQPHPNMQPYQVVSFCIALQGIFPSRN